MHPFKKLLIFLGGVSLVRIIVAANVELSLDEAYYWQWANHLSLSYYDHPPMVAVFIRLTTLLGETEVLVRLSAIIAAIASTVLIYRLTKDISGSDSAAFHSAWITNITLIFSVGAFVVSPDTPLVPFYLAGIFLFYRAVGRENSGDARTWVLWICAAISVGLAMLSKYTGIFFFIGAFIYLLVSNENRRWLKLPHPYVAAVISFIVFSPVIVWNSLHGWASFAFQAGHGLVGRHENALVLFAEFIGLQAALYSVGIFFFLLAAAVILTRKAFGTYDRKGGERAVRDENALFLFSFSVPLLAFFIANSIRAQVEGNWPILGFLPLFVYFGTQVDRWNSSPKTRRYFRASIALAAFLWVFVHMQVVNPVIPHPKRFEISRRVFGWKILASKIDEIRKNFSPAFIVSNRFQIGTLMTYYTDPHLVSYLIGPNNDRLSYLPSVDDLTGKNAIYITQTGVKRDRSEDLRKIFERVEKAGPVDIIRKGELIRKFTLYRCYNYRGGLAGL
ncbi:MAG: glycosyltransferase family 39 protein [Nitrospinota bacterium]